MTNAEKFKTAEERAKEFGKWCEKNKIFDSNGNISCAWRCVFCSFAWLDLEVEEEKLLPCPFCGAGVGVISTHDINLAVCTKGCGYYSKRCESRELAIAAHNRVARAVIETPKE